MNFNFKKKQKKKPTGTYKYIAVIKILLEFQISLTCSFLGFNIINFNNYIA